MEENFSFGKRLKEYRINRGYSQGELGELIGKAASTVYGYETDQIMPSCETLSRISVVLSVDIKVLLGFEEDLSKDDDEVYRIFAVKWWERKNEKNRHF